jgi:uncharacterized membrane protein
MTMDADSSGPPTLELAIGRLLRFGIRATTLCLSVGLGMMAAGVGLDVALALLSLGLLLLLATPVARVVISILDYARQRDWLFFVLTVVVLLELAASVVLAMYGAGP